MGPNYVYSYSKSHSYLRSDLPPLNTAEFRSIVVIENSMGPNYIYSYSKSHSYSRSDIPSLRYSPMRLVYKQSK